MEGKKTRPKEGKSPTLIQHLFSPEERGVVNACYNLFYKSTFTSPKKDSQIPFAVSSLRPGRARAPLPILLLLFPRSFIGVDAR